MLHILENSEQYLEISLVTFADLPSYHPLAAQGLLTPGYSLSGIITKGATGGAIIGQFDASKFTIADSENFIWVIGSDDLDLSALTSPREPVYCSIDFIQTGNQARFVVYASSLLIYRRPLIADIITLPQTIDTVVLTLPVSFPATTLQP